MQDLFRVIIIMGTVSALTSCTNQTSETNILLASWKNRYGPHTEFSGKTYEDRVARQKAIVASFVPDTSGTGTPNYYHATLAGYNFVDEECDAYIKSLFVLDRNREFAKEGINSAGVVTSGILGLSGVGGETMAIVAQAFGLASSYTNTLYSGYLFGASAASVSTVVSKLQAQYRAETAKQAANIDNSATAYNYIRGYLRLCLPPTIEANIQKTLSTASAVTNNSAAQPQGTGQNKSGGTIDYGQSNAKALAPLVSLSAE